MNIQTIQFLNQIKNASRFNKEFIKIPFNKNILPIVKILYKEGFLQSFKLTNNFSVKEYNRYEIIIFLRYFSDKPILNKLRIISTPSNVKYLTISEISRLSLTKNTLFFSHDGVT